MLAETLMAISLYCTALTNLSGECVKKVIPEVQKRIEYLHSTTRKDFRSKSLDNVKLLEGDALTDVMSGKDRNDTITFVRPK